MVQAVDTPAGKWEGSSFLPVLGKMHSIKPGTHFDANAFILEKLLVLPAPFPRQKC